MAACMELAFRSTGPVYLRMGKSDLATVHKYKPAIEWGDLCPVRQGDGPLAWIATGSMVPTALEVAPRWPGSAVWSAPSLKPLDGATVSEICRNHEAVVVLEEHSVYGGLGSAVCEIAAEHAPTRVCRVGISDRFSRYCGSWAYLMREHGLDAESVARRVHEYLDRVGEIRGAAA
jgi:transketolase